MASNVIYEYRLHRALNTLSIGGWVLMRRRIGKGTWRYVKRRDWDCFWF